MLCAGEVLAHLKLIANVPAPILSSKHPTVICKKYWKNCASSEKSVTTSKTLTESTMRSCTTIVSNSC